jgi:hypothetical protein
MHITEANTLPVYSIRIKAGASPAQHWETDMTYAARELTADELDLVSGGDVKEVHIGPLTITAGKGVLGIRVGRRAGDLRP